jgi:ubiquinone/menaquinone biosynthesis C-methylase UbiE
VRLPLLDVEPRLVNSPARVVVQRRYELPVLERLGAQVAGRRVLEIGCGRGVGVELLLGRLGARSVLAFDLDPAAVRRARRRLAGVAPSRVGLFVADATAIPLADASVEAVFAFTVLHHVLDWRAAVTEIRRVLTAGGLFAFSEITAAFLATWPVRAFSDHPPEDRFSGPELVAELDRQGLAVQGRVRQHGVVVLGVARTAAAEAAGP